MGKDFSIVPTYKLKVNTTSKMIASVMKSNRIDISKKNCILIGADRDIIFDINSEIIKGKILTKNNMDAEINIIKSIIWKMGINDVYVHFYGQENFFKSKSIKEV